MAYFEDPAQMKVINFIPVRTIGSRTSPALLGSYTGMGNKDTPAGATGTATTGGKANPVWEDKPGSEQPFVDKPGSERAGTSKPGLSPREEAPLTPAQPEVTPELPGATLPPGGSVRRRVSERKVPWPMIGVGVGALALVGIAIYVSRR